MIDVDTDVLATRAKTDEFYRDMLSQRLYAYVRGIAYDICGECDDLDDLASVGMMGMLDCVRYFNPDRDVSFIKYMVKRVKGSMMDFAREQFKTYIEMICDTEITDYGKLRSIEPDQDDWADVATVESLLDKLPDFDRYIIERYFMQSVSVSDIAGDHGMSEDQIYRIINAALYKMRLVSMDMDSGVSADMSELGRMVMEANGYEEVRNRKSVTEGAITCGRNWKRRKRH